MKKILWLAVAVIALYLWFGKGALEDVGGNVDSYDTDTTYVAVTQVEDLLQLRDYLNTGFTNGKTQFKFRYTGEEEVTLGDIGRITCSMYVQGRIEDGTYDVTLYHYPGERMYAAYVSSDESNLTEEEKLTLHQAIEMVNRARAESSNDFELEVRLHDMLTSAITYQAGDFDYKGAENTPRNHTAVGALRDGKANCQGYADAFYLLGSIAGFQVDQISLNAGGERHRANMIQLDGQWYILDVTFDDREKDEFRCYSHFNVGRDMLSDYTWEPEWESHPIANESSTYFYYRYQNAVYGDVDAMAAALASGWNGRDELASHVMVLSRADKERTASALKTHLNRLGLRCHYSFTFRDYGNYSYYTVRFQRPN